MRRITLAVVALLALAFVPSTASATIGPDSEFCQNLAVPSNGGTAFASSQYSTSYPVQNLNNDSREGNAWWDATQYAYPDWAGIEWDRARTLNRILVRLPIHYGYTFDARIQYWDGGAWVDVVGRAGQGNPVSGWRMPNERDGSEVKAWDFGTAITTTKIRVLFEGGSSGWSLLEEIAAYYGDGDCFKPGPPEPGLAQECTFRALDGTASASSVHSSGLYPVSGVNNGRRESGDSKGYWNDNTNGVWPDWVQIDYGTPQTVSRIVARIPLARRGFPLGEITLRRTRIQYYDDATSTWVDVTGATGQPNPIVDWQGPIETYDGSESRTFDLATPVTTTKIRALIEDGSTDGWSWLDELTAYSGDDCHAPYPPTERNVNLSLIEFGGRAFASSEYSAPYGAQNVNNGSINGNWNWWDGTRYQDPDWVGINWQTPRKINKLVIVTPGPLDPSLYTYRKVHVQYWDGTAWADVVGARGQDNPILNWGSADWPAGYWRRTFDIATPLFTTRVRVYFEEGAAVGFSVLDEIEAYWVA